MPPRRRRRDIRRFRAGKLAAALMRDFGITVLLAVAFSIVVPLTAGDAAHRQLDAAVWSLRGWGNQLVGLDLSSVRQNVFSLVRDLKRTVRVVDHDTVHESVSLSLYQFLTRGSVRTVGDVLSWYGVPLTTRQAAELGVCRTLDEFRGTGEIWVRPDPWQRGLASWYGPGFHGQLAASGEFYNMYDLTAAHKTLPLGSLVRVVSQRTGASTVVRINDRGPYVAGRIIDMSFRSKELLGMGDLAAVYLERLDPSALRVPWE